MENFTPVSGLIGGMLIGAAAALLMALNGRVAGVSGILGEALHRRPGDVAWRLAFLAGLVAAPLVYGLAAGAPVAITVDAPLPVLAAAGLLVGFGTRLANGCTSGHGVCGVARLSPRSVAATLAFTGTAVATLFLFRRLLGV